MIIPGSSYWNFDCGGAPCDVLNDVKGMKAMCALGENMDWMMKNWG